jgi:glutaminyl-peptide cyclotransferase
MRSEGEVDLFGRKLRRRQRAGLDSQLKPQLGQQNATLCGRRRKPCQRADRGDAAWQTASLALLVQASPADPGTQACREPTALRFNIVDKITRNEIGFTQGLEVYQDRLYESTGRVGGTTRLNLISFDGKVTRLTDLGTTVFGEGLTILNGEVFQLTWQDHEVFVYDLAGKLKRQMRNPRDGWGLTNDGTDLIFSDGGPSFYYADPRSFGIRKSVRIRTRRPGDVEGLNELELVGGKLFGNIFTTRAIVRIDPGSGCIDGVADLSVLWQAMSPEERAAIDTPESVLNGIAYDARTGLFYLTGKLWKTIFTGRFTERSR